MGLKRHRKGESEAGRCKVLSAPFSDGGKTGAPPLKFIYIAEVKPTQFTGTRFQLGIQLMKFLKLSVMHEHESICSVRED